MFDLFAVSLNIKFSESFTVSLYGFVREIRTDVEDDW